MELTLSGPYDDRPAILTIHSGAGGTDSHDWVEMLTGMYAGWAASGGRAVQVLNTAYGDEAGLRTSTLEIGGQHAFGYLNAEGWRTPPGARFSLRPGPAASNLFRQG